MLGDPLYQLPPIGPVDPEQPQLFTGPAEPGKEQAGLAGSETEAAVTTTAIRSPSVSTRRWRVRPFTFLPLS